VIDVVREEGLVEAAATHGERLRSELERMAAEHPLLADLRGRGLVQGIELRDPASGERFGAADNVTGRLTAAARERGLLIYACPTPVGNQHMDAVLLAPPLIIDDGEIDELLEKLGNAVAEVERDL